jgi:hypothetical protein
MSLAGVPNTHAMAAWLIFAFGTAEQRESLPPRLATGEIRTLLSWEDIVAADPLFWLSEMPTHLDIGRRCFTSD